STQKSNRSGQNSGEFLIFLFFFSGYQSFMPKHRVLQVSHYFIGCANRRKKTAILEAVFLRKSLYIYQ
ncbi:MAG: hypothetical protein LBL90_08100, partial [Prevotellaceae bacterium]|nr:hypothetical protein [Prevotellaceae bacterium]